MRKKICAIGFLLLLFVFCGCTGMLAFKDTFIYHPTSLKEILLDRDSIIERNLYPKRPLIHLYGGFLRLCGIDYIDDPTTENRTYRVQQGGGTFIRYEKLAWTDEQLNAIRDWKAASDAEAHFVYIPKRVCTPERLCSRGVREYSAQAEALKTKTFAEYGYQVLNLHEAMHDQDLGHEALYYNSDHHWKTQTALWAAREIAETLGLDTTLLRDDQYTVETYPDYFLGSLGRRVGTLYFGVDDFTLLVPKYDTDYVYANDKVTRTGTFREACLEEKHIVKDYFDANCYAAFLGGDFALTELVNRNNPDGTHLLMIKDSFTNSIAPYLIASCGKITMIDPRAYTDSISDAIRQADADVLLVTISSEKYHA